MRIPPSQKGETPPRQRGSVLNPSIQNLPMLYEIRYILLIAPEGKDSILLFPSLKRTIRRTNIAKFHIDSYKKVG